MPGPDIRREAGALDRVKRNRILTALPADELAPMIDELREVELRHGRVLYESDEPIRHVYFPLTGAASIIAESPDGESCDVAVVGNEGFVGLPVFLGTGQVPMKAVAQVPGSALEMGVEAFRIHLDSGPKLHQLLTYYTQMRMVEMGQTALCNRVHSVEQRTARWLLQLDERVDEAPFELTQEFFATVLGTHRPSVTLAAGHLRQLGLIDYSRGSIEVLDRDGLEAASCPCYRVVRDELDRLLRAQPEGGQPA